MPSSEVAPLNGYICRPSWAAETHNGEYFTVSECADFEAKLGNGSKDVVGRLLCLVATGVERLRGDEEDEERRAEQRGV